METFEETQPNGLWVQTLSDPARTLADSRGERLVQWRREELSDRVSHPETLISP